MESDSATDPGFIIGFVVDRCWLELRLSYLSYLRKSSTVLEAGAASAALFKYQWRVSMEMNISTWPVLFVRLLQRRVVFLGPTVSSASGEQLLESM